MYGYLVKKEDRTIIRVLNDVTHASNNEIANATSTISGFYGENSLVFGIVTDKEFVENDKLPTDVVDKTAELNASNTAPVEQQLAEAKKEIARLTAENVSNMVAITTLFELLPSAPAQDPVSTDNSSPSE